MNGVSEKFQEITREQAAELSKTLSTAWQDEYLPLRQWNLVAKAELERFRAGERQPVFKSLLDVLKKIPSDGQVPALLEVGSASAYYSEILEVGGFRCDYVAVDYSQEFQRLARQLYPNLTFHVADARALPFPDMSFDIVLSGCCLLHIFEYELAIQEAVRVSANWLVLHRTPIVLNGPTRFFTKEAYAVPCIEIHFGRDELGQMFSRHGLAVVAEEQIFSDPVHNYGQSTILLKRVSV